MDQAALDKGLYPSQRKLSESINVDTSLVSKSVALAKLPASVIDAFPSPLDVQFRLAQPLVEALQKDPEALVLRAVAVKGQRQRKPLSAADVFAQSTGGASAVAAKPQVRLLKAGGRVAGNATVASSGAVAINLNAGVLTLERQTALIDLVADFLK